MIFKSLNPKVFVSIKDLEFAHEFWKRFKESYRTPMVKKLKLYVFKNKYAKFKMQ